MIYTTLIEPLGIIGVSLMIGMFIGALWMFLIMYNTERNLLKELDAKNKELDEYINKKLKDIDSNFNINPKMLLSKEKLKRCQRKER